MTNQAYAALGEDGKLAHFIDNFAVRQAQQEMSALVYDAMLEQECLVVEAGTGIGKTFAYLVPAVLSGLRVVVSTGTKNLQDQLYHRDLPLVMQALGQPLQVALLKGRANYLCRERLLIARSGLSGLSDELLDEIEAVYDWSQRTDTGDIAELHQLNEKSLVWPMVTSNVDNCLGQACGEYDRCHVVKARRKAQEADVLVVNHHLLMADLLLKDTGFGELLPGAEVFVIDEAHQLPDIATAFFGISLSSRQMLDLLSDIRSARAEMEGQVELTEPPIKPWHQAMAAMMDVLPAGINRYDWSAMGRNPKIRAALMQLLESSQPLYDWLHEAAVYSRNLENCKNRLLKIRQHLRLVAGQDGDAAVPDQEPVTDNQDEATQAAEQEGSVNQAIWLERMEKGYSWHVTPIDIAGEYCQRLEEMHAAWIYTSATLAIGESFTHFEHRLGVKPDHTACFDSPFDYENNALLYIPENMPDPGQDQQHHTEEVTNLGMELMQHCAGGLFLLFTSHRALKQAAQILRDNDVNRLLLVQGEAPRAELLNRFRQAGDAVLLGTSSFWEGVDVRGAALSCVVIDKLPFASPADPMVQARVELYRRQGMNPFMQFQVPQAVIALKQGVGRLIRDVRDRGVMVICDPRIKSKPYGKSFLSSMPPMHQTRSLPEALEFLDQLQSRPDAGEDGEMSQGADSGTVGAASEI